MIEIAVILLIAWTAFRAFFRLRKQSAILQEFDVPATTMWWALALPLGFLLFWIAQRYLGMIPATLLAVICFGASFKVLHTAKAALETSGTDRTKAIYNELGLLSFLALAAIIYVVAALGISRFIAISAPIS